MGGYRREICWLHTLAHEMSEIQQDSEPFTFSIDLWSWDWIENSYYLSKYILGLQVGQMQ